MAHKQGVLCPWSCLGLMQFNKMVSQFFALFDKIPCRSLLIQHFTFDSFGMMGFSLDTSFQGLFLLPGMHKGFMFSSHGKLLSVTASSQIFQPSLPFTEAFTESWPTTWPTGRKFGSKAAERGSAEHELFLEENRSKAPEYNGFYTPERLVRMRSPVRIWPAAPNKPDSFENQAFLRLFYSELGDVFSPDPPADPREG